MANTPDYSWPPQASRKVIGTSPKRLDGPQKAAGRANLAHAQHRVQAAEGPTVLVGSAPSMAGVNHCEVTPGNCCQRS